MNELILPEYKLTYDDKNSLLYKHKKLYRIQIDIESQIGIDDKDLYIENVIPYFFADDMQMRKIGHEIAYCVSFDNAFKPTGFIKIADGEYSKAEMDTKHSWLYLLSKDARYFMLLHNHPNDNPLPSKKDFDSTKIVHKIGINIGSIELIEHVIISTNYYYFMLKNGGELNEWPY